jgi:DNA helicase-4
MNNAGEYRICAKPTCRWWMPICPDCNGSLLLRESKYGQFWGCENYRNGCTHKQKYIEGPSIENPA